MDAELTLERHSLKSQHHLKVSIMLSGKAIYSKCIVLVLSYSIVANDSLVEIKFTTHM